MTHEEWIGTVTHYYPKAHAAAVHLDLGKVQVGDRIHIKAPGLDIRQTVESLEIDRKKVEQARAGQDIGILVHDRVPENANVFVERPD